jgi:hypothetical protein
VFCPTSSEVKMSSALAYERLMQMSERQWRTLSVVEWIARGEIGKTRLSAVAGQ